MKFITEYIEDHIVFLNTLMFELYDVVTKKQIYDYYDRFDDVTCFLPGNLDDDNSLTFVLIFDDRDDAGDRRIVRVSLRTGVLGFVTHRVYGK